MIEILAYISIIAIILIAYLKGSITKKASIIAIAIGIILYISSGWISLITLYAFFISSSILSKIKKNYKEKIDKQLLKKGEKKDILQVLGSGGVPLILAIINLIIPNQALELAIIISIACANADTWASEIGILSKRPCRSILTFKEMPKGLSGGFTLLGLASSLFGSLFIAGITQLFQLSINNLIIITIFGFLGSIIDSILGHTIQPLYYDKIKKTYLESNPDKKFKKIKGITFITNEMINFLSPTIITTIYLLIIILK